MTAPNHALTGALIGLGVGNPWIALPAAFLSHFVCDAIPHYDPKQRDLAKLFRSYRFVVEFLLIGAGLCFLIVLLLALYRPHAWLQAAVCAFLAASPDLLWLPRFLKTRHTGKDKVPDGWFFQMHDKIQWKTGPKLFWFEVVWFLGAGTLVLAHL